MRRFGAIIFFILLFSATQFVFAGENLKLVFALDLVRHGDRNTNHYYPKVSKTWAKTERGKLTPLGRKEAKSLGKKFWKYYVNEMHLLPENFQPNLVYVRSTNFQRTKETARSLLKGMFPANSDKINIFVPLAREDILNTINYRGARNLITKEVEEDIANLDKGLLVAIQKQLQKINHIFGTKLSEIYEFSKVADVIKVSKIHKKPFVKKLSKQTIDKIIALKSRYMTRYYMHPKMACLYAKNFIIHLANLLESKQKQKYFLYVAHDSNIMTIVPLLGGALKQSPPYLSDLRFEVLQDKNQKLFVRTSLDGKNIKLCESSNYCPLAEYVRKLRNNVASCEIS